MHAINECPIEGRFVFQHDIDMHRERGHRRPSLEQAQLHRRLAPVLHKHGRQGATGQASDGRRRRCRRRRREQPTRSRRGQLQGSRQLLQVAQSGPQESQAVQRAHRRQVPFHRLESRDKCECLLFISPVRILYIILTIQKQQHK